MLRGAVGPRSLVIIQSEMTDSEGKVRPRLVVYQHVFPSCSRSRSAMSRSKNNNNENTFYDGRALVVFIPSVVRRENMEGPKNQKCDSL